MLKHYCIPYVIFFGQQVNRALEARGPGKLICLFKKNSITLAFVEFLAYNCCMKNYIKNKKSASKIDVLRLRLSIYQIGMFLLAATIGIDMYFNKPDYYWLPIFWGVICFWELFQSIKTIKSIKQKRPTN